MSKWRGSGESVTGEGMERWQVHVAELSLAEAAEALGVSRSTVQRARRSGVAPRALSDPQRAESLRRSWSAYRHTARYRQRRTEREKRVERWRQKPPGDVRVAGRSGPNIPDSNAHGQAVRREYRTNLAGYGSGVAGMVSAYERGGVAGLRDWAADAMFSWWSEGNSGVAGTGTAWSFDPQCRLEVDGEQIPL